VAEPRDLDLFLRLALASSHAWQVVKRELDQAGIEIHLFGLLTHLSLRGPMTPSSLAAEQGIPVTTMRDQIQLLVERGLVERRPNAGDGRSYLVDLTPNGTKLAKRGAPAFARARTLLEAELDRPLDEVETAVADLEQALLRALARKPAPRP
jgi:DNA-binding MarR family transcriptional regulator